jgi:hypothetical protein
MLKYGIELAPDATSPGNHYEQWPCPLIPIVQTTTFGENGIKCRVELHCGNVVSDFEGWSFESITDKEGMFDLCIAMLHSSQVSRRIRVSPQSWVGRGSATILYVYSEFHSNQEI